MIPKSVANRRAMERIVSILRLKLQEEVDLLNDTGNVIPVPPPEAFHMLGNEEDIERILAGTGVACFIYPASPTQSQDPRTGDGINRGRLDVSSYRIVILFKALAGYEQIEFESYPLSQTETTGRFADILRGATIDCLHRYAVNQDHIHEINVTSDLSDFIVLNNSELTGRAIIEVEIWQDVFVPMSSFSIV